MPLRVPDINTSIYTDVNPENVISAKKGTWFFRKDKTFYLNYSGGVLGQWIVLPNKTVIIPAPNPNKVIIYRTQCELWEKTVDGYRDEYRQLLPKTGWKFKSYDDVFVPKFPRPFRFVFPVPSSSYDPVGVDGNKSYDENFYYVKSGSLWYRTPIALFAFSGSYINEQQIRYDKPPYCVAPRAMPVPGNSHHHDHIESGDQTYDSEYFYIKPSLWKRTQLGAYDASTMTMF